MTNIENPASIVFYSYSCYSIDDCFM